MKIIEWLVLVAILFALFQWRYNAGYVQGVRETTAALQPYLK